MPGNVDRRPWVILSVAEGQALLEAALAQPQPSEDLHRAVRVLRNQLRWLRREGGSPPSLDAALQRADTSSPRSAA